MRSRQGSWAGCGGRHAWALCLDGAALGLEPIHTALQVNEHGKAMFRRCFALLALALATLALGEPLQPEQVYQVVEGPGRVTILAPGVTLANQGVLAVLSSLQLEACAAACRLEPRCAAFEHCDVQVSFSEGWRCSRRPTARRRSRRAFRGVLAWPTPPSAQPSMTNRSCRRMVARWRSPSCNTWIVGSWPATAACCRRSTRRPSRFAASLVSLLFWCWQERFAGVCPLFPVPCNAAVQLLKGVSAGLKQEGRASRWVLAPPLLGAALGRRPPLPSRLRVHLMPAAGFPLRQQSLELRDYTTRTAEVRRRFWAGAACNRQLGAGAGSVPGGPSCKATWMAQSCGRAHACRSCCAQCGPNATWCKLLSTFCLASTLVTACYYLAPPLPSTPPHLALRSWKAATLSARVP